MQLNVFYVYVFFYVFFFFVVTTPEESVARYHRVLTLVQGGETKAAAYDVVNIDRNTIVNQAPIAELAVSDPEHFRELRATFRKGDSLAQFSSKCQAECRERDNAERIALLKQRGELLDITRR